MPEPSSAFVIRPVAPSDVPAITAIYAEAVLHGCATFELTPPSEVEMNERIAKVDALGFPWLVAEDGGRVLGYAYLAPYRPRPAYRFTAEDSIYVDPATHGRGIGRRLLEELLRRGTDLGLRRIVAVIGDSANAGSIALHAACGFHPAGVLPSTGWKHGRWLDSVLMQIPLGEGDASPPVERDHA